MKIVRITAAFLLGVALLLPTPALAAESGSPDASPQSASDAADVLNQGEIAGALCTGCGNGRTTERVGSPVRYNKKFVRFLTSAWTNSTGYSWSHSTTVSSTLTANIGITAKQASGSIGVSSTRTKSYTVTANIYADRKRLSRLGLYSDFNRYKIRTKTQHMGISGSWKYSYLYSPLSNQYLIPVYKK